MTLRLSSVSATRGDTEVLRDLQLVVPPATVVAVIGESGSGKSTLLRVVAGLERPDAGSVSWDGMDLAGVPPHRRDFGLMFQDLALFPHRSVAGNVAFGLEMAGIGGLERSRRVAEVLELVDLTGFGDRSVTSLSGGEQQRVALARALAPSPRLLMLDEPLESLDRPLRERLAGELRAIFDELDIPVLYVTHDQGEAFAVADEVAVLNQGRIEQQASPQHLWEAPATAFVARFIGIDNVVDVDVRSGSAATPWGVAIPVRVGDGPATLAIRAGAVTPDSAGPIRARTVASTFESGTWKVELIPAVGPALVGVSTRRVDPGTESTWAIDPDGAVLVD